MTVSLPQQLYRAAQVREMDRLAIEEHAIPGYALMCKAGTAAFAIMCERWPHAHNITVVCGSGNNAGDGYIVARLAHQAGLRCHVLALQASEKLPVDARRAYSEARDAGVPIDEFCAAELAALKASDVIVDALLGTGINRPLGGIWNDAVGAINQRRGGVLSIDIPSGLHGDSGAMLGDAVRADLTVTFIALKQGLFTGDAPACCGAIYFDDLDIPPAIVQTQTPSCEYYQGRDLDRQLPRRARVAHKGHHGHVLVIGGNRGMGGAARMTAEAAARVGAGLVSVATHPEHASAQAAQRPELMFHGVDDPSDIESLLARASVIAIGPGLSTASWGQVFLNEILLSSKLPLVADADALNLLAEKQVRRDNWVLTPHPGEAGRLLNKSSGEVQIDRFAAARSIAQRYGGVCVLKGAGSIIDDGARTSLCSSGNPGMGSGGMGDVLTGVVAGLLAQGLSTFDAGRCAVFIHGRAGDLAARDGERGLLATDLMAYLRTLVNPVTER